ncbi:MAG: hypothetical protein KTR31_00300 [Myxococcales bacterium]|nr:hypothetical protein [Myxococcales bacterium]
MLTDLEKRIVAALGQTMFPRDKVIDLDGEDVQVVAWVEGYVGRMPPFSRGQIRALLQTFNLGFGAWARTPGATFASAKPSERAEYLETWERSTTYTQRQLYEALRAMMTFAYADAPDVAAIVRPSTEEA